MTGYMGAAMEEYTYPQQCYNSQNHWHLGWFGDRQIDIDSKSLESGPMLLHIAAFVDYDKTKLLSDDITYHILVRIAGVVYLQYNRAKDHNVGSTELGDKLVIVKMNTTSGTTDVLVGLDSRQSIIQIPITDEGDENTMKSVVVEVCLVVEQKETKNIPSEDKPDYMIISIGYNSSSCEDYLANPDEYKRKHSPTAAPALSTSQPSVTPSIAIREIPIQLNSIRPTQKPNGLTTTKTPPTFVPTQTKTTTPTIQTEAITSRITKNRTLLILFLLFQVCFLSGLFILYILFVRQYKQQKIFWKYKEDQKQLLLAQNGQTNHDAHSLFNEADNDLSSTVSFTTEQNDTHLSFSGFQNQEHVVA
jgi:hypothetical protein